MKILFDILPAKGHYNASLRYAKILSLAGIEISFIGTPIYSRMVNEQGYTMHLCEPFIVNPSSKKPSFFHHLYNRSINKIKIDALKVINVYKSILNNENPDLIIMDEQFGLKGLIYIMLGYKISVLQTMPEPNQRNNVPPFTSYSVSQQKIITNTLWMWQKTQNYFKRKLLQILTVNQDECTILKHIVKKTHPSLCKRINYSLAYGVGIKGVSRVVLVPEWLGFPTKQTVPNTYYLGFSNTINDNQKIKSLLLVRYKFILNEVQKLAQFSNRYTIYCSLGTLTELFIKRASTFYKKIMKVATLNPNDIFILSIGSEVKLIDLYPVPNNVFLFENVPQDKLLSHIDIMIGHGGINSIKECIQTKTPMLIYPLSKGWDQPGNSATIILNKLGLRGRIKFITPQKINSQINYLKNHFKDYKNRLNQAAKYQSIETADTTTLIQNILN